MVLLSLISSSLIKIPTNHSVQMISDKSKRASCL
jgi:hypothetical protein